MGRENRGWGKKGGNTSITQKKEKIWVTGKDRSGFEAYGNTENKGGPTKCKENPEN